MLFSNSVLAMPGIPNVFYGSVTWNGASAPDGTIVVAKISGVQVASTTTLGGKYGYDSYGHIGSFYVDDPDNDRSGKTINFFVNNVDTGKTAIFCNGCFNLCGTNSTGCPTLDLSATGSTGGTGGSSGSGGSGGGGGGPTTSGGTTGTTGSTSTSGTTQQSCQERWICSEWSACQDGVQTRTCTDENNCGTNNNEPFNSQPCSAVERNETQQANALLPTGFFLGLSSTDWIIAIVAGIIIAMVVIFLAKRKSSSKK